MPVDSTLADPTAEPNTWKETVLDPWVADVSGTIATLEAGGSLPALGDDGDYLAVRDGAVAYVNPGWANVRDFGIGDAAWPTTYHAEIQAVLNAHKWVLFPRLTGVGEADAYYLGGGLTLATGHRLEGYNTSLNVESNPQIKADSATLQATTMFTASAETHNVALRHLAITGSGSSYNGKGIYVSQPASYWVLEDITMDQFGAQGIHMTDTGILQLNRVFLGTVCQYTTGLADYIGAVHVAGADMVMTGCEFGVGGNYNSVATGYRCGAVLAVANSFLQGNVFELSEIGCYFNGGTCAVIANRCDLNERHGWVIPGDENRFVGNWAYRNSQDTTNTYDGFYITGHSNVFSANAVEQAAGDTTVQRYGFHDATNGDHDADWRYANVYDIANRTSALIGTRPYNFTGALWRKLQTYGTGSPESVYGYPMGSEYTDLNTGNVYYKKSAAGTTTGWKLVTTAA